MIFVRNTVILLNEQGDKCAIRMKNRLIFAGKSVKNRTKAPGHRKNVLVKTLKIIYNRDMISRMGIFRRKIPKGKNQTREEEENMLEKLFHLKENKTTVKTEVTAGITSFFTMAYIIFVNPQILSAAGMDAGAVMLATCVASAIGTFLMAFLANYPFALAPGMGLNAFFAFTICGSMGYSWQAALAAVFISGCLFIIITVTGVREAIVRAIPMELKNAISVGIGFFIAFIGLKNANMLKFTIDPGKYQNFDGTIVADASPIPAFNFASASTLLAIFGLIVLAVLYVRKVKGALFLGILITSAVGCVLQFALGIDVGVTAPTGGISIPSLAPTFMQFTHGFGELFNFSEGVGSVLMSVVSVLISLVLVDMFDTIGTLIGTATRANMLDKEGNLPRANGALLADAIATACGAVLGTSTVTTFVESSAGVSEGGRTGLTSLTTGVLFLVAIVASPFLGLVPTAATAPVLIIVGVLMMASVKNINWGEFESALPAFMTIACMPFAYSIADGIAAGFIFFTITKLFKGKAKEVHPIMYVLCVLFILRFIIVM